MRLHLISAFAFPSPDTEKGSAVALLRSESMTHAQNKTKPLAGTLIDLSPSRHRPPNLFPTTNISRKLFTAQMRVYFHISFSTLTKQLFLETITPPSVFDSYSSELYFPGLYSSELYSPRPYSSDLHSSRLYFLRLYSRELYLQNCTPQDRTLF